MPTPQDYQAQETAFSQQFAEQQAQKAQEAAQQGQPQSFVQKWTAPIGRATTQILDGAVSAADAIYDTPGMRKARDITAGAMTGAMNIADFVKSAATSTGPAGSPAADRPSGSMAANAPAGSPAAAPVEPFFPEPIWDHAKQHILDFRDAVAVQDPTMADSLTQSVAQLAVPFAGYSRALSGLHWVAQAAAAGALTDATALGPHDARMADLLALGKHTEGKFGEVLRTLAPDGSALNAYINYLHDRTNETDAEGRWKNVLDGFGVNLVATPLLHGIGMVLKQGTAGLRYMVDNGVPSSGGLVPPQMQRGGPAAARQAMADPMDAIATKQAQDDMAKAAANPPPAAHLESLLDGAPSSLEDDKAVNMVRTLAKSQNDSGIVQGSTHDLVTALSKHMDGSTEDGAFYKEVFGKLASKNLDTKLVAPGMNGHPAVDAVDANLAGRHSTAEDTTALYPKAFASNGNFVHTLAHESVHAATMKALASQPEVRVTLSEIAAEASKADNALAKKDKYGLTSNSPKEFVAEAEANPRFQQFLKNTKDSDGRPLWDRYKEAIGGIFGLSAAALANPRLDKLLTMEKSDDGT